MTMSASCFRASSTISRAACPYAASRTSLGVNSGLDERLDPIPDRLMRLLVRSRSMSVAGTGSSSSITSLLPSRRVRRPITITPPLVLARAAKSLASSAADLGWSSW
jgi:hypothetical protein